MNKSTIDKSILEKSKIDTSSELIVNNNSEAVIVCFGGFSTQIAGIPYDFLTFLTTNFANIDKFFYRDTKQMCYHQGIDNISKDIETTVSYLKTKLAKYKRVIFTGTSAGAYAAILYGSLVNVTEVIVFNPITILYGRRNVYNLKYIDLSQNIINNTTKYYLCGDSSITNVNDLHHIKHCKNISSYQNVKIMYKNGIDLKQMRNTGELYNMYNSILNR